MRIMPVLLTVLLLTWSTSVYAATATFEDLNPPTSYNGPGGGGYYNGADGAGGFLNSDFWFTNNHNATYGSWDGWAYSNTSDTTTAGYTNQYSAVTGSGADGSDTYGVAYMSTFGPNNTQILFGYNSGQYAQSVESIQVTNTTYAALSMQNGDSFAKQFGGLDGTDPDWFLMTVYGLDAGYARTAESVSFYLADYRSDNPLDDYILTDWHQLDLTGLGTVYGLEFELSSSDVGAFGMNTPAYFAMDNLEASAVPVPAAVWLLGSGLLGLIGLRRNHQSKT